MDDRVPGKIFSFGAMHEHCDSQPQVLEVLSATGDPDTMYYHQAMRQLDAKDFLKAVQEEFAGMLSNQISSFTELTRVPPETVVFLAVWAMKRKQQVKTREVYKWKARLAFDGSWQVEGVHYDQTYAPVASWETIRLLLNMVLKNKWKTRQLDYSLFHRHLQKERCT
jgi:Reverse transcriptase (RNA-dependent DNA polymerase)